MSGRGWGRRLPPVLAPDERVLWQGRPAWRSVARHLFHLRSVAFYFVALTVVDMAIVRLHEAGRWPVVQAALPTLLTGGACVLILAALAWATERTTTYTLTTRRLILQFGIALPATLAVPLHRVAACSLRLRRDHVGDICLQLRLGDALPAAKLWPHVRPHLFGAAEPMLRDLPQAATVAPLLCRTLAAAAEAARPTKLPPDLLTAPEGGAARPDPAEAGLAPA